MTGQPNNVDRLLTGLESQAEQGEVYAIASESTAISFEAGELKSAQVDETSGVALRAIKQGRVGFTATSGHVDPELLVARAVDSARFGDPTDLTLPGPSRLDKVDTFDQSVADLAQERLVEIGKEIVERLRSADASGNIGVEIERTVARTELANSAGCTVTQRASALQISFSMERVRGDDVLMVGAATAATTLTDEYRALTERVAAHIQAANRPAEIASGRMPVLFSPSGSFVLWLPLLMALNGEHVQRGTSPLAHRLGESIVDAGLTLWDDPTVAGRPGSAACDDEGVPAQRKALIHQGVARSFLFDLKTAALAGTQSTGNGSRSLFSLPSPSAYNLVLEPGETTYAEMLAGISHGLLVHSLLGLGQGNPLSGAFSNPVGLAFVIENGEITGRVKDVTLAGNIYALLSAAPQLSQEREWVYGRYHLPHVLIPELDVVRG
ncbi:MAG: TldD/PmbA family protein [Anaerolineae bacterium]|jgi:PmbA protein|nr:TldD/PmbA family protein [Chloroflexota bacterium]